MLTHTPSGALVHIGDIKLSWSTWETDLLLGRDKSVTVFINGQTVRSSTCITSQAGDAIHKGG